MRNDIAGLESAENGVGAFDVHDGERLDVPRHRLPVFLVSGHLVGLAYRVEALGNPCPCADAPMRGEGASVRCLDRVGAEPRAGRMAAHSLWLDVLIGMLRHDRRRADYPIKEHHVVLRQIDGDFVFAGHFVGVGRTEHRQEAGAELAAIVGVHNGIPGEFDVGGCELFPAVPADALTQRDHPVLPIGGLRVAFRQSRNQFLLCPGIVLV